MKWLTITKVQTFGSKAEKAAKRYLEHQGLNHLLSNYRCALGEIDLIMNHQQTLVFVEVRARQNPYYGDGAASVTWHKQEKLKKTAAYFLSTHPKDCACRFDVISVHQQDQKWFFDWIQAAFY